MLLNFLFLSVLSFFLRGNIKDKEFSKEEGSGNSQYCKLAPWHFCKEKPQVNLLTTTQLIKKKIIFAFQHESFNINLFKL